MSPSTQTFYSRFTGVVVMILAAIVMCGWIFNVPVLTTGFPGYTSLKFNAAICFALTGLSVFLFAFGGKKKIPGIAAAVAVALIGGTTFLEYLLDWNAGIDELIIADPANDRGQFPGRMNPAASLNFLLIGIAATLIHQRIYRSVIQVLVFVILTISLLAFIGYNFKLDYTRFFPFLASIPLHATLLFLLISSALFFAPYVRSTRLPLEWKLVAVMGFIILIMAASFYMFNRTNSDFIEDTASVDHARQVLAEAEQVMSLSKDIQSGARGYIITGNEEFLEPYRMAVDSVFFNIERLRRLTINNPAQQQRIDSMQQLVQQQVAFAERLIQLHKDNKTAEAMQQVATGQGLNQMLQLRAVDQAIKAEQNQLLDRNKKRTADSAASSVHSIFIFQLLALMMLVLIYFIIQSNQRARNKAEQELKESEEWFSTTLSSIGDGVIVTDHNCKVIFMNPVARSLTKWGNEAYGKLIETVFEIINEKTRKPVENPIRKVLRDGLVVELANHTRLIRKDKTEIDIDDSAAPIIDDEGAITGVVLVFRDVSEKKKTENVLRYNSLLLENISDAVFSLDDEYRIVSMNTEAERLFNVKFSDVKGKYLEDEFRVEFPKSRDDAEAALLKKGSWQGEMILYPKDRPPVNVLASAAVMFDEDEQVVGIVNVLRDITPRIKAEEQNRYNSILFQNISDAIISTDADFRVRSWNKTAEEMYGYTEQEAIGMRMRDLLKTPLTDDERNAAVSRLQKTGYFKDEYIFINKRGELVTVLSTVNVIRNASGAITGYMALHRNISERKKAEEQIDYLAGLIEQTSDAIFSVDTNLRIISWNRGAEEMYGYSRDEVIGKDAQLITQSEYSPEELAEITKSIRTLSSWSGDRVHRNKNGNTIYTSMSLTAIHQRDGEPTGFVVVARDITERKKLEEQLRNFNQELETQVKEKTQEMRDVFYRVSDGFMAFDKDWRFTFINKKAGEIFHIDPSTLIGKVVWEAVPKAIGNPFYIAAHKAMAQQEYVFVENYSDIFNYWYESHLYPSPNGLSVYFRDVTERKKALELLSSSEETRRLIVSRAMDAIVCADEAGNITVWNAQAENIFGWKEEEVLGKSLTETIIPERYKEAHARGIRNFAQTGQGPMLNRLMELHAVRRNGEEFPIEITIIPLQQEGAGFSCAFIRDITERKKTQTAILKEKALSEKIIDSLPGIFYFFDHTGRFLRWNKMFETISGYSAEEISRMHPTQFFAGEEQEYIAERIHQVFADGVSDAEAYFVSKDGTRRPFYFTGTYVEYDGLPCLIGTGIDITERKKAEVKLHEERVLLRTLIDNLPDYIYVKDKQLRHIINNKANVALLGAETEEETLGKSAIDYFGAEAAKEYMADDRTVLSSGLPIINREEKVVTTNGEQRWLLTTKVPLFDEENKPNMIVGISRDITERKLEQKELERSNERFEMIARTTNDAIWEWELASGEVWANEMHQHLYGLSVTDPIPDHDEWKNRLHPEDRDRTVAELENLLAGDGSAWIAEYRFLGANNEYKSIYDRTYIVRDNNGRPVRMLGSMVDITARKKAEETLRQNEEKYRLLFASSPLPMWVYDLETFRFVDVNEAAINHYGYKREEFLAMTVKDIRPPEEVGRLIATANEPSRGVRYAGTWKHYKKDGTLIETEINSHDIIYNNKNARLVLANDVTEKLNAQRQILETTERLRQLSARLQEIREEERMHMAHEIHDELGQRLTVLKMDVSWLGRRVKPEDEPSREKIQSTLHLLDGTIKIVRKIATELRPGILDDLGLIPALEWQSKEFEDRSGIRVHFESNVSEIELPTSVATGLFRIFQESLTNVGRHAQAENIISYLAKDDGWLTLRIEDDGKGFDTASLGSKKTLGIMGMKERTAMIDGEYDIRSTPGEGTIVTVRIPLNEIE
jgi:PAS domain S-box-containing protein